MRCRWAVLGLGAVAALSVVGCSSTKATDGQTTAAAGEGKASLVVDGKDQTITGNTGCVTTGDRVVISVGDQTRGVVGATVTGDQVETLGIILNGQPLAYTKGVPGSTVTLKKDGKNYALSGQLTGAPDMSNPMAGPSTHQFTMDVTCPG